MRGRALHGPQRGAGVEEVEKWIHLCLKMEWGIGHTLLTPLGIHFSWLLWGRSRLAIFLRGHRNIGRRAVRRADTPSQSGHARCSLWCPRLANKCCHGAPRWAWRRSCCCACCWTRSHVARFKHPQAPCCQCAHACPYPIPDAVYHVRVHENGPQPAWCHYQQPREQTAKY